MNILNLVLSYNREKGRISNLCYHNLQKKIIDMEKVYYRSRRWNM